MSAHRAARGPGRTTRVREPAVRSHLPPPRGLGDPWAWASVLAVLPLAIAMRGAPWGEPVAEDFDFLHRALFQGMGSLLDGGGSQAFWRPIPHQLYYAALGRLILSAPAVVTTLHLALLALGALLIYRALRREWSGALACAAASFTLFSESTRTIAGWATQFVDLGLFVFSALAVHEASRRRPLTALAAALGALLCKEVAVVTAVLLPFVPGAARDRRERVRLALGSALLLLAWGAATLAVRRSAHLELPGRITGASTALGAHWPAKLAWAFDGTVRALASLPRLPGAHDGAIVAAGAVLVLVTAAVFALHRPARARLARVAPWCAWGLAWFALATATLTPIFPSWQPNRSQYGGAGFGVCAVGALGAAHPALAGTLVAGRLLLLERAPRAVSVVTDSLAETGAFMDWPHLTRLQRFLRAARRTLAARYPTLPHGAIVVQENLPHQLEYALGGDRALQAWYRDPTLRWMRFDAFRDSLSTPVTVIVQGEGGHTPEVALVEPEAVRMLFAARPLMRAGRYADALASLDRADSLQRDRNAVKYFVTSGAWRAYAWVETHRDSEAVLLARHVLEMDPRYVLGHQVLALSLAYRHDFVGALRELDVVDRLEPGDPAAAALREQIEARLGAGFRPPAAPPASPPGR